MGDIFKFIGDNIGLFIQIFVVLFVIEIIKMIRRNRK